MSAFGQRDRAAAGQAPRLDEHVLHLAAVGAAIHPQSATDRCRECHAGTTDPSMPASAATRATLTSGAPRRRCTRWPGSTVISENGFAEANDDPGNAAVPNEEVRAEPDDGTGSLAIEPRQERCKVFLVRRSEEHLGRATRAEPRQRSHGRVRFERTAQTRDRGPEVGCDVREHQTSRRALRARPAEHRPIA